MISNACEATEIPGRGRQRDDNADSPPETSRGYDSFALGILVNKANPLHKACTRMQQPMLLIGVGCYFKIN